jgi:hypothetical protein
VAAEQAALDNALDRLRLDRVRHAETLVVDPREHPDLWELDGALITLVDRMLLELDTAAHAALWEDRRQLLDRRRATELLDRLRPHRRPGSEPAHGHDSAQGNAATEGSPSGTGGGDTPAPPEGR